VWGGGGGASFGGERGGVGEKIRTARCVVGVGVGVGGGGGFGGGVGCCVVVGLGGGGGGGQPFIGWKNGWLVNMLSHVEL